MRAGRKSVLTKTHTMYEHVSDREFGTNVFARIDYKLEANCYREVLRGARMKRFPDQPGIASM